MSAFFYANFEDLDLNKLDSILRDKILFLHGNNELFYKSIHEEDFTKLKEQLSSGFPVSWKDALKQFSEKEQEVLNNFIAPPIPNDAELCTDELSISFDNNNRNFEMVFLKKEKIDFNRNVVELLASFYFQRNIKRDIFKTFKFLYFATAVDKSLTQKYIKNILDETDVYINCLNGLLFNKDSSFFDMFIELKKDKPLKNLLDIFSRPLYRHVSLNENSYKKAITFYVDFIIDEKMNTKIAKNVIGYTNSHAINEVFSNIYVTDGCKDHIYHKYKNLTGIESVFAPVAIAYSEITRLDIYFEIEWEGMPDSFKEKYPKKNVLSKSNETRKKNFLERNEKEFKKVFDQFCENNEWQLIAKQCELLGIPEKYYPKIYYKDKLEHLLAENKKNEIIKKL